MRKIGGRRGFTLVELSLAVGFIGILSLTITLIINDTVATYRRGLTLNQVNTTGMDLVDDFRSAIQNSPAREPTYECESLYAGSATNNQTAAGKCAEDHASALIHLERWSKEVDVDGDGNADMDGDGIPVYGIVCTGAFSYIWNSGYFYGENAGDPAANASEGNSRIKEEGLSPATFTFGPNEEDKIDNFRLLKIKDERRGLCKSAIFNQRKSGTTDTGVKAEHYYSGDDDVYKYSLSNDFNVTDNNHDPDYVNYFDGFNRNNNAEVVLADSATNPLALYDFTITNPVVNSDGESSFYSVSFVLGTLTGGLNVRALGNFCKTPEDYDQDFDYCAINKFNFAAQATGG